MDLSSELFNLIKHFGFNILVIFVIVKLIYQRNHPNNLDFVFTYFMFNALIFFVAFSLASIKIDMGFAFGMFAVFAILRYRTNPIPIKEMTYLFIAIAIGHLIKNEPVLLRDSGRPIRDFIYIDDVVEGWEHCLIINNFPLSIVTQ